MIFQNKVVVVLKNNISFTGNFCLFAGYFFIKQSEKSNTICFVPYSRISVIYDIRGKEVVLGLMENEHREPIEITDEERLIRVKGGISLSGYLSHSDSVEKELTDGVLLCVNKDELMFYYIENDEIN
ncbi:TPA: hypothetical protein JRS23_004407 [Escherichia coli]|nr:hypothetical protein [Escherichia coli]